MFIRIKKWLEPPHFPDDEEKTAQARIINTVGLYFVLTLITAAVVLVYRVGTLSITRAGLT